MKVYVVTTGVYSDFKIDSIWSTQEKAEAYLAQVKHTHYPDYNELVSQYELDEIDVGAITHMIDVYMCKDGSLTTQIVNNGVLVRNVFPEDAADTHAGFMEYRAVGGPEIVLAWRVDTEDKEKAVKVVGEMRGIILANNAWGDAEKTEALFASLTAPRPKT